MAEGQGPDIHRSASDKGVLINQIPLKHSALSPNIFSATVVFPLASVSLLCSQAGPG